MRRLLADYGAEAHDMRQKKPHVLGGASRHIIVRTAFRIAAGHQPLWWRETGLLLSSAANPTVVGSMVILPTFAVAHDRIDFASAQAPMISRIDASTGSLAIPERSVALSAAAAALCGQRGRSDAEGESHRESKRRLVQHVNLLGFVSRVHQRRVRDLMV